MSFNDSNNCTIVLLVQIVINEIGAILLIDYFTDLYIVIIFNDHFAKHNVHNSFIKV